MRTIDKLKASTEISELAVLLGCKSSALTYVLYRKPIADKYHTFKIAKKFGGTRKISAPDNDLKLVQSRLSEILQQCISEINTEKNIKKTLSHGFRKDYSIMTNATVHKKRKYVFNIDLHNFFGEINFGRVRGYFLKNRNFELNEKIATVIAQIICFDNELPQGSPSSPVMSNLVAHSLDIALSRLAYSAGCTYSRYADDITFSTNKPDFPANIAIIGENIHVWEPALPLSKIISKQGFSINSKKTRMQYYDSRQEVTGLIVNKKVNVRSEYWRNARAMAHSLMTTGRFYVRSPIVREGITILESKEGTLKQLDGILSFIDSVDKYNKKIWKIKGQERQEQQKLNMREQTYKDFVFYKNFRGANLPLIITEGKTDPVYLGCAIKQIGLNFPNLAKEVKGGKIEMKVRFFNYQAKNKNAKTLMGLSGGVGPLQTFIGEYDSHFNKHKHLVRTNYPVILLVDNDDAGLGIGGTLKNKKLIQKQFDGSETFYYLNNNLYVVVLPKLFKKATVIEDCFDEKTLGGRVFSKIKGLNEPSEASDSKNIFSKVVQKNQSKINFDGFSGVLGRLNSAIEDYQQRFDSESETQPKQKQTNALPTKTKP